MPYLKFGILSFAFQGDFHDLRTLYEVHSIKFGGGNLEGGVLSMDSTERGIVLKFLEGRKENRVWYNGSYYALGILDDTFASHMQRLQGNSLQERDLDPPRSVVEARSILCRDAANSTDTSSYYFV
ncbi:hypothetical protein CISIN_1g041730mg [Citrus sinensis]|uniref:Uncharacterized protein n=1 Tax=Citrus sinensis TaxID=2711 RepID=A0A067EJF9_CITSI|nr:hypothetical protein CISIN_1g041730mg [Citrus sinensis]